MIERVVLSALLALAVVGNGWQWWHGLERFAEGRAAERATWERTIEDRNMQIEMLAGEVSIAYELAETARAGAAQRAGAVPIDALPADVVAKCSLPESVRADLNAIRSGGGP